MATDSDLAAAVTIALAIILIALCGWPGFARARARDLAGYWADAGGALHEIRVSPQSRGFVTRGALAGGAARPGHIEGVRGVVLGGARGGAKKIKGHLELGGRRILWQGGGAWTRQGVR